MHIAIRYLVVSAFILSVAAERCAASTGAELYGRACAACHGADGKGRSFEDTALIAMPPDFSDCEFASREPDADWYAIIHDGGPVRAFDRMMPAFGNAISEEDAYRILAHIRTFCTDKKWPRGEFNLPRPMYTEKAFPEDEAVFTLLHDSDDAAATRLEVLYEKRFGPEGMLEVALPLVSVDDPTLGRTSGLGDIAIGYKHTLSHSFDTGNILSAGVELILPTGDADQGLGKGTSVIEPFVAYGKLLPRDMFFQAHAFVELPVDHARSDEIGVRMAFGRTWTSGGPFGRAWSPMIEMLGARRFEAGARTSLDIAPQLQVSLNTRQHVLLNFAARIPVSETKGRDTQYGIYLLWDWFDGGFLDGW